MSLFRKAAVEKAGGFVSRPRLVSEDMEMTLSCHRQGRVAIVPSAIGYTGVPETLSAFCKQRFRWAISGTMTLYWHRRGIANRRYWFAGGSRRDGLIGFVGLPFRVGIFMRDLCALGFVLEVVLLLATPQGRVWAALFISARGLAMGMQLMILKPALQSRQGIGYWWLIPLFVLVYGPLQVAVRFVGTWAAIGHVWDLRKRGDTVLRKEVEQAEQLRGGAFSELVIERRGVTREFQLRGVMAQSIVGEAVSFFSREARCPGSIGFDLSALSTRQPGEAEAVREFVEAFRQGAR
jgi:hypothetical protein